MDVLFPESFESIFFVPNTLAQEYDVFVVFGVVVVSLERMNDNIIIV